VIEAIGAATIRCPHCRGEGIVDDETGRLCPICRDPGRREGDWCTFTLEARGWLELPISPEVAERIYAHAPTDSETYDLVYDTQAVDEQWEREQQAEREAEADAVDAITELARARRRAQEIEVDRADYLRDQWKDEQVGGRR